MYLDFGAGLDLTGEDLGTVAEFRNIFGAGNPSGGGSFGTGANLDGIGGLNASDMLNFRPLNYDFDGNSVFETADITALSEAVLPIIQRALEPFDIDVQIVAAGSFAEAAAIVGANAGDPAGQFDAYNFIADVRSAGSFIESVGFSGSLFGIAAADDLFAQAGNTQDEATFTFTDVVFNSVTGVIGTEAFNRNLAYRVAYTAAHEGFHTLTGVHSVGLEAGGDIIRLGSATREDPFGVLRFDLARQGGFPVAEANNYLMLANDPDIGLRDSDGDGTPDLAYVSGTGAHDVIQLTDGGGGMVNVSVSAYSDSNRTTLIGTETYTIDLAADTEGEILIDAGTNSDLIQIDAGIAASFRIRGGSGFEGISGELDEVFLLGGGTAVFESTPDGGTFTFSGGRTIVVAEAESLNAGALTLLPPGNTAAVNITFAPTQDAIRGISTGFVGGFIDLDGPAVHTATVDWGDGTTGPLNVTQALSGGTLDGAHVYDRPGVYNVLVTVSDGVMTMTQDFDVTVRVAGLRPDPLGGGNALYVMGGIGADRLLLGRGPLGIAVFDNGLRVGAFTPDTRVIVYGGDGNDVVTVRNSVALPIEAYGERGNDRLIGGGGDNYLDGGHGRDFLFGRDGDDVLIGGQDNDVLIGNGGDDQLDGGSGDDLLVGRGGHDDLYAGAGSDRVSGGGGDDYLEGDSGDDVLFGDHGDDVLDGGDGNDVLIGRVGADRLRGGVGNDRLSGGRGDDLLDGGDGDDRLIGQFGTNVLLGGAGADLLLGGHGEDLLIGGIVDLSSVVAGGRIAELDAIYSVWTASAPVGARAATLEATLLDRGTTVVDDGEVDILAGGPGVDVALPDLTLDQVFVHPTDVAVVTPSGWWIE